MKIQPIKYTNIPQNCQVFCFDDEMSKERRKYIREHLEEQFKDDEIRNSGRLSEYELNQLIKSLVLAKPDLKTKTDENSEVDEQVLRTAGFLYLRSLYGNNSYRAGLNQMSPKMVEIARQAGIKHIVDLRNYEGNKQYEGVSYYPFSISNLRSRKCVLMSEEEFMENELGDWDDYLEDEDEYFEDEIGYCWNRQQHINERTEEAKLRYQFDVEYFRNEFVKFIQTMQKGNVLIGCEFGTEHTDFALWLDKLFNPQANIMIEGGIPKSCGYQLQNMYENLTQEDKEAMGWDEEFDKNFLKRLKGYGFWV